MKGPFKVKANLFEKANVLGGVYCQLAMKVKPSKISEIIDEISKKANPCRILFDGENYIYTSKPCPTFKIPNNFPTFHDLTSYVADNFTLPFNQRLGSICYNDDYIVLNGSHAACDGGYLKLICHYLAGYDVPKDPNYAIHESLADAFASDFKKVQGNYRQDSTEIRSSHLTNSKENLYYYPFSFNIEETNFYKEGKSRSMTEKLINSILLTAFAYNHKFSVPKIMCAFDGRRALKNYDWRHANIDGNVTLTANGITLDSTIGDMENEFRKDIKRAIKENDVLRVMKDYTEGVYNGPNYSTCSLSNIGVLKTGGDIIDACINTSVSSEPMPPGAILLISQCLNDTLFRGRFCVCPCVMSKADSIKFGQSIEHCLKTMTSDMTIKETIKQINDKFLF